MLDQATAGIGRILARALLAGAIGVAACGPPTPTAPPHDPAATVRPMDSVAVSTGRSNANLLATPWQPDSTPHPLWLPTSLAVDGSGILYVIDAGHDQVQTIASTGQPLARWGGTGTAPGQFRFSRPPETEVAAVPTGAGLHTIGGGVAVDGQGQVYVADTANARIQKFDRSGQYLAAWATGTEDRSRVSRPMGLAIDQHGHVYVADAGSHRIIKYDSTGAFLLQWGTLGRHEGEFNGPMAVAVDGDGHVYVADSGNHRIQQFDDTGWFLAAWGGQGSAAGEFGEKVLLAVDEQGRVYATDWQNHRVQVFDRQGTFLTQWGSAGRAVGEFVYASGVAVDGQGAIYVADLLTGSLQQFRLRQPLPAWVPGTPPPRPARPLATPVAPQPPRSLTAIPPTE